MRSVPLRIFLCNTGARRKLVSELAPPSVNVAPLRLKVKFADEFREGIVPHILTANCLQNAEREIRAM